jgi:hypothetical protein
MLQRGLAWLLLAAHVLLLSYGFVSNRLYAQPVWEAGAPVRFLLLAAGFALASFLLIAFRPRWYLPIAAAFATLVITAAGAGVALLGLLWFGLGCYSVGALWMRHQPDFLDRSKHLSVAIGIACAASVVTFTAHWQIHYAWVYWLAPAVPLYFALRLQYIPNFRLPQTGTRRDLAWLAVLFFVLLCHLLAVLKPEVAADGLAQHLVVVSRMGTRHAWIPDIREFLWAVEPIGGDFLLSAGWQFGGEAGARLLNFGLLCVLVWILVERLHARVPGWIMCGLTAAFLSTPLAYHLTGNLGPGNFQALMILGATLLFRAYIKERRGVYFYALALLAGAAVASGFGALAYVLPLLLACALKVKLRHLAAGIPIGLAAAGTPFVTALMLTGNPVFPYFNAFFHSAHFDTLRNLRDPRFETPLDWTTWYDLTVHGSRFGSGLDSSLGFFLFWVAPLAVIGLRRNWPRTGYVLLWVAPAGMVIAYLFASKVALLYPALTLFTLLAGIAVASYRAHGAALANAIGWLSWAALALNLAFLPAAGPEHREFSLDVFTPKSREAYLAARAPERRLIDWLNREDPTGRAAWLERESVADFRGRPFVNSWQSPVFHRRFQETTTPEGIGWLAQDLRIGWFIAPGPESVRLVSSVHVPVFLDTFTEPVAAFGDMELRRWDPPAPGSREKPLRYARPGRYDEVSLYSTYDGYWTRDVDFPGAWKGTLAFTNDARSRVVIRFEGHALRLIHTAAANRCRALVSLDDGGEREFSEFAPAPRMQSVSDVFAAATAGRHHFQLRFPQAQTKRAIQPCFLDIDGFVVE